jgi:twitching motility protein PilT
MSESNEFSLPMADPTDKGPRLPVAPPPVSAPPLPPVASPPAAPLPVTPPPAAAPPAAPPPAAAPAPAAPPSPRDEGIRVEARTPDVGAFLNIDELLLGLLEKGASDLHLSVKSPPMMRVHGDLEPFPGYSALTDQEIRQGVYAVLTERQRARFEDEHELDFAYELSGAARFRVNLMQQQGNVGAVLRAIPWEITPLESLKLPEILAEFALLPRGLVLVTGPTGSGKSTTLAAILDRANRLRAGHIVTIEDPIEFVHPHRRSLVSQREVGRDTDSFGEALKRALRQDPDIILVGEMRDLETIAIALTAAETGHLVFGTLHTSSAASTIDRIIDVFPGDQQGQVRTQLANSLQAVVCQTLCKTTSGKGRVAATEVMISTPAINNLIREGKLQSIPSMLQTGSRFGMHTLNQNLAELVDAGAITYDTAVEKASDLAELNQLLGVVPDAAD